MDRTLPKPTLKWLFFGFSGRIARQSFIFACLFQLVLMGLAVYQSAQGVAVMEAGGSDTRLILAGFLSMVVIAFNFWSILALSIKRLHDLNHPWQLVIVVFIPALTWLALLYLMIRPGYHKANEHGPPPQGV
jgi:uncharacterized membrane protein YhaH (DUF805 family)